MSDQPQPPDRAIPFRQMADRIAANDPAQFAGAMCIVPPTGPTVELLMLSGDMDDGTFWGQLKVQADIALSKIQDQQTAPGWGARR